MKSDRPLRVRILGEASAPVVQAFRRVTPFGVNTIVDAIRGRRPMTLAAEWTAVSAAERVGWLEFFEGLTSAGVEHDVLLGEEMVSHQFIGNQISLRAHIEHETAMLTDLESGEPSPEALAWEEEQMRLSPDPRGRQNSDE